MPKKSPGERYRYIAFRVESPSEPTRSEFLDALIVRSRGSPLYDNFRITVFGNRFGILKVPHVLKNEAISILNSVDSIAGRASKVETLLTSGTIKTLKSKYKKFISEDPSS